jgi:hypothetical protein
MPRGTKTKRNAPKQLALTPALELELEPPATCHLLLVQRLACACAPAARPTSQETRKFCQAPSTSTSTNTNNNNNKNKKQEAPSTKDQGPREKREARSEKQGK